MTSRGLEHMHKLVAMVQGTGRYPSRSAVDPEERTAGLAGRKEAGKAGCEVPTFYNWKEGTVAANSYPSSS